MSLAAHVCLFKLTGTAHRWMNENCDWKDPPLFVWALSLVQSLFPTLNVATPEAASSQLPDANCLHLKC
jgi:hypothetical protein